MAPVSAGLPGGLRQADSNLARWLLKRPPCCGSCISSRPLLVLPNAWDVASAKALAAVQGCRALATTSSAVARSLGWEDGERAPRDEMVEAARRIAAAVDLPVTADLERGYGDPVGTARAAWDGRPRRDQLRGLDRRRRSSRSTSRRR